LTELALYFQAIGRIKMFMNFPPYLPCSNRRRLDPRKQGDGFTLTELLVVIGVIALLAATLLPALAGTKIGTKNIQCLNNLRQLTSGALMYQSDNGTISWGGRLQRFVDDDCTFRAGVVSHPAMPVCHGTNPRGHSELPRHGY
jgi:prepilin-type N-terminal cleavage/methylation domain-containing protein